MNPIKINQYRPILRRLISGNLSIARYFKYRPFLLQTICANYFPISCRQQVKKRDIGWYLIQLGWYLK